MLKERIFLFEQVELQYISIKYKNIAKTKDFSEYALFFLGSFGSEDTDTFM